MNRFIVAFIGIGILLCSVVLLPILAVSIALGEVEAWMKWFTDKGRPGGM